MPLNIDPDKTPISAIAEHLGVELPDHLPKGWSLADLADSYILMGELRREAETDCRETAEAIQAVLDRLNA